MSIDAQAYIRIFDALPLGLLIIDQTHTIRAWNQWMVKHTEISAKEALGQSFFTLYENQAHLRLKTALDQVLHYGYPQILSSTLNKYIIPIPLKQQSYLYLGMMQQKTEIIPIRFDQQTMALVVIQDVSDKVHLKNTLLSMAVKFEKNSLLDMLTGVYNRRFLWKYLEGELETAYREQYNVICVMIDLDHFKKINDRYGHNVGDELLISFAELAKANIRPNDYLFRYGGEEFLIIHTRISLKKAKEITERLRKKLEKQPLRKFNMTCSGGIACWQPGQNELSAEKLINQADRLMYQAKRAGRNQIFTSADL